MLITVLHTSIYRLHHYELIVKNSLRSHIKASQAVDIQENISVYE